jgi:hypothetical protein
LICRDFSIPRTLVIQMLTNLPCCRA